MNVRMNQINWNEALTNKFQQNAKIVPTIIPSCIISGISPTWVLFSDHMPSESTKALPPNTLLSQYEGAVSAAAASYVGGSVSSAFSKYQNTRTISSSSPRS